MSFDRMDNFSGGAPGSLPRRSLVTPSVEAQGHSELDDNLLGIIAGRGAVPVADVNSTSLTRQWADKSAMWGGREFAAMAVNQATESKYMQSSSVFRKYLKPAHQKGPVVQNPAPVKNYSHLFHLGSKQVDVRDLVTKEGAWSQYSNMVKDNLGKFKTAVSKENIRNFFRDVTPKSYIKDTVVGTNVKPIKDLMTNSPDKRIGTGVFQTAALGLLGYDVVKHTHDAYTSAKAKEDGSLKSRLNTYKETAVAFGKYALRNGATWEAAGVGAAIGRAAIPLALGPVSLGGIAVGTVVGIAAQKALDHAMKTGDHDPVQQEKDRKKKLQEAHKSALAARSAKPGKEDMQQNPFKIQPA